MDKDNIEGKMKDVGGRIKRQAGEWTGDEELQSEGAKDQAEGKAQNLWGKVKDSIRETKEQMEERLRREKAERDKAA